MGQTLTRAAQWTSVSEGGQGRLEFSPVNEALLDSIIKYVESFPGKHPAEAEIVFKSPLQWKTALDPSAFGLGYETSDDGVTSEAKDQHDQPLLTLRKLGELKYDLKVHCFNQLSNVLRVAGEMKMREARSMLEANSDPTAKMIGDGFATIEGEDNSTLRLLEQTKKESGNEGDELESKLRLLLLIQQFDMQLMNQSLKHISQEVRLTPQQVNNAVALLKRFCGNDSGSVLESIVFTTDYVFDNGCRSPPWRQVHGDICCLNVIPLDGDLLTITANTAGVYMNKGVENESNEQSYERVGDVHKDLLTLLKAKSPKFAERIASKEFEMKENQKVEDQVASDDDVDGDVERGHEEKKEEKNVEKSNKQTTRKKKKVPTATLR